LKLPPEPKILPEEMSMPLNDRIKSAVFEYSDVKISDLARRTFELVKIAG
jgi:hypothetical protein